MQHGPTLIEELPRLELTGRVTHRSEDRVLGFLRIHASALAVKQTEVLDF